MTQQCPICHAPLERLTPGMVRCHNDHMFLTADSTISGGFSGQTSTTGYISLSGPEPEPDAFYRAFEEEQEPRSIAFVCANCKKPLTITAYSPSSIISGVFCQKCDEQYYVRWADGILKRGRIEE
jgi:hypothetical protein